LELLTPVVLVGTASAIPDQIYYIDEITPPATVPVSLYTHSLVADAVTYPLILSDTRLDIKYEII
jgi:hypothetical protein